MTDVIAGAILGTIVSRFIMKHDLVSILKKIIKNQFELKRQLFHMATGVIVACSIYFLEIRDGSGFVQGIVDKGSVDKESWENCENMTQESSIIVFGEVTEHPKKPGVFEIQISKVETVQV